MPACSCSRGYRNGASAGWAEYCQNQEGWCQPTSNGGCDANLTGIYCRECVDTESYFDADDSRCVPCASPRQFNGFVLVAVPVVALTVVRLRVTLFLVLGCHALSEAKEAADRTLPREAQGDLRGERPRGRWGR